MHFFYPHNSHLSLCSHVCFSLPHPFLFILTIALSSASPILFSSRILLLLRLWQAPCGHRLQKPESMLHNGRRNWLIRLLHMHIHMHFLYALMSPSWAAFVARVNWLHFLCVHFAAHIRTEAATVGGMDIRCSSYSPLLTCCSCVFCIKCSVKVLYSLMSARALYSFLQLYVIIMFYTWDPARRYTLLLSAHTCTHIVSCTIYALISFNYLLHQSFSSAISPGTMCLWGSPARPPAGLLHLISGLPVGSTVGAECLRAVHRITPRR